MNCRRLADMLILRPLWDHSERHRQARVIEQVKRVSDAAIAETYESLREKTAQEYKDMRVRR